MKRTLDDILRDRARETLSNEVKAPLREFERHWQNPVMTTLDIGGKRLTVTELLRMISEAVIEQHSEYYERKEIERFMAKVDELGGI